MLEVLIASASGQIVHAQSCDNVVIWGGEEYNTNIFVRVQTDLTMDEVKQLSKPWRRWTTYDVLNFDPANDLFEVKMYASPNTVDKKTGEGSLSLQEAKDFLSWWGAVVMPESDDTKVIFSLSALDVLNGKGFIYFNDEDEFVDFTEKSYDPVSGTHVIYMDYSLSKLKWDEGLGSYMKSKGVYVSEVNDDAGNLTFSVTRDQLIQALEVAVQTTFNIEVGQYRHYVAPEIIQAAKDAGGLIVLSKDNFTVIDRLEG
jgi:hypothetical protein